MGIDRSAAQQRTTMSKLFRYAGIAASVVLIAFGIGAAVIGLDGRDRVATELAREQIVGTPDSTIPNQLVNSGSEAQAFAKVIRKHTLESTGGKTYAEMPRFVDAAGKGTNDEKAAAKDPKSGGPAANPARNLWVTSTALTTALNTAYFAESMATFVIAVGLALLLTGIGFLVLTLRVLRQSSAVKPSRRPTVAAVAVPH
jgi:F0F1-type ATP synthase membrane subunit c/vacuolar-type H+-ATPase subunit K